MSDLDILLDESKPIDERVKAAEKIARRYDEGSAGDKESALFSGFMRDSISTLDRYIKAELWTSPLEEAIIKGVYNYKVSRLKENVAGMSVSDLATKYAESTSDVEKKILSEALHERKDEIETIDLVLEALKEKYVQRLSSPDAYPFMSDGQISSIKEPSKRYAREAFRNGLWNVNWGDPSNYGINIESEAYYVARPMNRDFAIMMYKRGMWLHDWGEPSEYGIKI